MEYTVIATCNWPKGWSPERTDINLWQTYGKVLNDLVILHPGCIINSEKSPQLQVSSKENSAQISFIIRGRDYEHIEEIRNSLHWLFAAHDLRYLGDWGTSDVLKEYKEIEDTCEPDSIVLLTDNSISRCPKCSCNLNQPHGKRQLKVFCPSCKCCFIGVPSREGMCSVTFEDLRQSSDEDGEVIVNIWPVCDALRVYSFLAKPYVMSGNDEAKLLFLKSRAMEDVKNAMTWNVLGDMPLKLRRSAKGDPHGFVGVFKKVLNIFVDQAPSDNIHVNGNSLLYCCTPILISEEGEWFVNIDGERIFLKR
jgi:hypothetical protein